MLILISYDIIENKKRTKIMKILEEYGKRVQKSVFECDVDEKERLDIYSRLNVIMMKNKEEADSLRFYMICEKCLAKTKIIGAGKIEKREEYLIV